MALILRIIILLVFIRLVVWAFEYFSAVIKNYSAKEIEADRLPYGAKPVMSRAERLFFTALEQSISSEHLLLSKVRLSDFLKVDDTENGRQGFQNKINQKHTDFLIVDRDSADPLMAIELDDGSHQTSERTVKSDQFKDEAFQAAGLPLLRVQASRSYSVPQIRESIEMQLNA